MKKDIITLAGIVKISKPFDLKMGHLIGDFTKKQVFVKCKPNVPHVDDWVFEERLINTRSDVNYVVILVQGRLNKINMNMSNPLKLSKEAFKDLSEEILNRYSKVIEDQTSRISSMVVIKNNVIYDILIRILEKRQHSMIPELITFHIFII
eukprot:gene6974-11140_t